MKKPIRILFDGMSVREHPAGVGYVVFSLLKELLKYDNLEFILYTRKGITALPDSKSQYPNLIIHETGYPFSYFGLSRFQFEQIQLPRLIHQYKPDILHLTNSFGVPFFLNKEKNKLKIILTVHDLIPLTSYWELMSKIDRFLYKLSISVSISKADSIIAISNFTANDIKRYCPNIKNVSVISDGIRSLNIPDNFDSLWQNIKNKYHIDKEYILYLGGFAPRKNVLRLLEAYHSLRKTNEIDSQLILSGRFSNNSDIQKIIIKIENYIKYNNLQKDVLLIDYLSDNEKTILLSKAMFFVYPSLYEGFGLPVLEALSLGTPVLTSQNSAMEEIAQDYALYFDPKNINDLMEKFIYILNNYDIYKRLAQSAKINLIPQFSWKRIGELYNKIYLSQLQFA